MSRICRARAARPLASSRRGTPPRGGHADGALITRSRRPSPSPTCGSATTRWSRPPRTARRRSSPNAAPSAASFVRKLGSRERRPVRHRPTRHRRTGLGELGAWESLDTTGDQTRGVGRLVKVCGALTQGLSVDSPSAFSSKSRVQRQSGSTAVLPVELTHFLSSLAPTVSRSKRCHGVRRCRRSSRIPARRSVVNGAGWIGTAPDLVHPGGYRWSPAVGARPSYCSASADLDGCARIRRRLAHVVRSKPSRQLGEQTGGLIENAQRRRRDSCRREAGAPERRR